MATQSQGISSAEQAVFTQRKLEELYRKTYHRLSRYRNPIEYTREVLVWQKPLASVALYIGIHWAFVYFAQHEDSLLTQLANLIFWLLLADTFWRAATRDGETRGEVGGPRRRAAIAREISFDQVLLLAHTPRGPQQLFSFELFCLHIAELLMWLDNIWLALRHWSVNDPLTFGIVLIVPGFVLSLLGKYVPTIVIAYLTVMGTIVWPYVEYHNLRVKTVEFLVTHFPGMVQHTRAAWAFVKKYAVSREEGDHPEFSLVTSDDEATTQQALEEEFDRALVGPRGNTDPGMSVLQDSVLGLQPNAFQDSELDSLVMGSLAPGTGEFPSISTLDQSLTLSAFPPQQQSLANQQLMPTIEEEEVGEEVHVPQDELDPFMDSVEVEFGFGGRPVRRSHQHVNPHGIRPFAPSSAPAYMHGFDTFDSKTGRYTPPPSYDEAVSSGENYTPRGYPFGPLPPPGGPHLNISGMAPRDSSTPMLEGGQVHQHMYGLRYRTGSGSTLM